MKKALLVSFVAAAVLGMASINSAHANCRDNRTCITKGPAAKSASAKKTANTKKYAAGRAPAEESLFDLGRVGRGGNRALA